MAMTRAVRIDDVIPHAGDRLEVRYTEGEPPLPAEWTGSSQVMTREAIVELARSVLTIEALLALALSGVPATGDAATFIAALRGRTVSVDLSGLFAQLGVPA